MKTIECAKLSYSCPVFERRPGFVNGFKDLFNRKVEYQIAVDEINFGIEQGEFVGILGENGAGKTTLMKLFCGILTPKSGAVSVLEYEPSRRDSKLLSQIGVMFGQKSQLIWDLPAIDTLNALRVVYNVDKAQFEADLKFLVQELKLEDKLYVPVRKLSLGQRVKFNLIATVIHRPKVLLLDEPTIGMDVLSQSNIHDFLKKLNAEQQTTIILSSHNSKDIQTLAQRVIFLKEGKTLYDGTLHQFRLSDRTKRIYLVGTAEDCLPQGYDSTKMSFEQVAPASFRITVENPKDVSLFDFRDILSLQEEESDLDEILKALYSSDANGET